MATDNADLLRRYQRAWSENDIDSIVALMAPDGVYEASFGPEAYGARHVGHEAIRAAIEEMNATSLHPGSTHDYGETYLVGDYAFAVWTSAWTNPDGTSDAVNGADLYEFRDGLVTRKIAFRKAKSR